MRKSKRKRRLRKKRKAEEAKTLRLFVRRWPALDPEKLQERLTAALRAAK